MGYFCEYLHSKHSNWDHLLDADTEGEDSGEGGRESWCWLSYASWWVGIEDDELLHFETISVFALLHTMGFGWRPND